MADNAEVTMKPTLGLTGLTMNAMALIAPGAFLWLDVRRPGIGRRHRAVHVGGYLLRAAALPCHGSVLRGDGKTLSRHGKFVLFCGAIVP